MKSIKFYKIILIASSFILLLNSCSSELKEETVTPEQYEEYKESMKGIDYNLRKNDSIEKVKLNKIDSIEKIELNKFYKTKAGKIFKKHPEWTKEDCENLANNKIWIGMKIKMVSYLRGLPDSKNISNYGHGNEYQYCWSNYDISCFYTKEDQIVYAYN